MNTSAGYFSVNNIPILYFENAIQAQTIEESFDGWLRMHTLSLHDLRDIIFMECTFLLTFDFLQDAFLRVNMIFVVFSVDFILYKLLESTMF